MKHRVCFCLEHQSSHAVRMEVLQDVLTCLMTIWVDPAMLKRKGRGEMPSRETNMTSAAEAAASEGTEVSAIPTSAAANAGASLIPSPTCNSHMTRVCGECGREMNRCYASLPASLPVESWQPSMCSVIKSKIVP